MANSVCHFDVHAEDLDRAMSFYGKVFGWTFEAWGPPDFYLINTGSESDPGMTHGALTRRAQPLAESGLRAFRCSISVVSVDKSVAAIEENGGTLRSTPIEIPGVGTVVEFADTEDNIVCVVQYTQGHPLAV